MGKIHGGPSVKLQLFEKAGMTARNMKDAEAIQERLSDPKERAKDLLGYFYPRFKIEYNRLKDLGYISERADGCLTWHKSKQCLAEYFGYQKNPAEWKYIEAVFYVEAEKADALKDSFKMSKIKKSKDYEDLLKILNCEQ
jgi:hypothetical protein